MPVCIDLYNLCNHLPMLATGTVPEPGVDMTCPDDMIWLLHVIEQERRRATREASVRPSIERKKAEKDRNRGKRILLSYLVVQYLAL